MNKNTLIIKSEGDNKIHHFICADFCLGLNLEPDFVYSFEHAHKLGWKFSKQKLFSMNGDIVAICPKCSEKYNWGKNEIE